MDERIKFVARLLDGEQMASLCREFGIKSDTRMSDKQDGEHNHMY